MEIKIKPPFIKLEQFLKLSGVSSTGGQAKNVIAEGLVSVNGEACLQRGKKLRGGEEIRFQNKTYKVTVDYDS